MVYLNFNSSASFGRYRRALMVLVLILNGCAISAPGSSLLESHQVEIKPLSSRYDPIADAALNLMVAEIALNSGNTELAVDYYLRIARVQKNPIIAERAVRVAVYGQNLEAAVEAAQRWIELDPGRIEAQQVIATIYIRQKEVDRAAVYLEKMIESSELDDARLFPSLLGILAREKDTEAVLSVSKQIATKYIERAHAQYLHGMLSAQHRRAEEAIQYLDRSLAIAEIDGAHPARARLLLQLGRSAEALTSLKKALEVNPDDKAMRLTYARLLVDTKAYGKAREQFQILHKASPEDAELLYTLGLLSLESQRLDDAEKYMMMLVRMDQREGEAQYYLGRIFESRKQFEKSIDWYGEVHSGEYKFDARLRIADLLGLSGRTEEALEHLEGMLKGSQSDGSLIRIISAKGELLRVARRYPEAMEVFNAGLDIIPGNTDLLFARALVAERLGLIDQLEADIGIILKTEPDNAHALNALGFTLADQTERFDEAYEYIKRAIEIMPDDPAIIDSWGWVHYRLGDFPKAITLLRKALSRYQDSEISAHLGEVLWAAGNRDEAQEVWQKALKKTPDNPVLQRVMQRFIP